METFILFGVTISLICFIWGLCIISILLADYVTRKFLGWSIIHRLERIMWGDKCVAVPPGYSIVLLTAETPYWFKNNGMYDAQVRYSDCYPDTLSAP